MSAPLAPAEPFVPLCMTDDELERWHYLNRLHYQLRGGSRTAFARGEAIRPCIDCTRAFADEMGAKGLCNGEPGAIRPEVVAGVTFSASRSYDQAVQSVEHHRARPAAASLQRRPAL